MCNVINMEDIMVKKVSKLINMDFRPSEISKMLGKPIDRIHYWMGKR